jgi:hypothetical protein
MALVGQDIEMLSNQMAHQTLSRSTTVRSAKITYQDSDCMWAQHPEQAFGLQSAFFTAFLPWFARSLFLARSAIIGHVCTYLQLYVRSLLLQNLLLLLVARYFFSAKDAAGNMGRFTYVAYFLH